jgi:hypothetical protein
MNIIKFEKILTENDVGETGSHQAGILIPKSQKDFIEFLPELDPELKNPDSLLVCVDEELGEFRFRYVYYNNYLHDPGGTRNEYRVTRMTGYLRAKEAKPGSRIVISGFSRGNNYRINILPEIINLKDITEEGIEDRPITIKINTWRRVH